MAKLIEVREFDTLIGNPDYREDKQYKYLEPKVFQQLKELILLSPGNDENADAFEFMKISYKRNVGETITIKNYVGLIQMKNGYQIQVMPKISLGDMQDTENTETKRIFLKMLRSLKDFPSKVFSEASLRIDKMNLYEIFINMYLQDTRKLVKRGIKSAYITEQDNIKYFKGKLIIDQHIQKNTVHKERFYVQYDEHLQNRAENKLIKATLIQLQKLTSSTENAKEIRQLLTFFEMVDKSVNYDRDFSRVNLDRSTEDYQDLMRWSKVFLYNKSFATFSGDTTSRSLLFPMESVYESYIAKMVKRVFVPFGWNVTCQASSRYLFSEPRPKFLLKPDIMCKKGDQVVVMDTKWKRLVDNESKNYGISQADMYQMYAYSKKYGASEVWVLYPITDEMRDHSEISYRSDDGVMVHVYFVDLKCTLESIEELRKRIQLG